MNIIGHSRLIPELEGLFQKKAKEKQESEGRLLGGNPTLSQKSDEGEVNTKKELAKIARVSHDTIAKVKLIHAKIKYAKSDKKECLLSNLDLSPDILCNFFCGLFTLGGGISAFSLRSLPRPIHGHLMTKIYKEIDINER